MQINGRQLRVTINRQNHLNAMRNHLRQSNLKALEVNIRTKERKKTWIEELSKKIHVKLNEASCRRQINHSDKLRGLQCKAVKASEKRTLIQKRENDTM